jgi:hypothetical protein
MLSDAGLYVAKGSLIDRNTSGCTIDLEGGFEQFAECARELEIHVAFLEGLTFDEEDFCSDYDAPEDAEPMVDLREINPELRKFEAHLGSICVVTAIAFFGDNRISYSDSIDWFKKYGELRDEALAELDASASQRQEQSERERQARQETAVHAIRGLSNDPEFKRFMSSSRQTLQSIAAYVQEKVEGVADLRPSVLRDEARHLRDKHLLVR